MIELDYNSSFSEPMTVALGFFDCVHRGHRKILAEAVRLAQETKSLPAVFTFRSGDSGRKGREELAISYRDRLAVFEQLGIRAVISVDFDEKFASHSAKRFLKELDDGFIVEGLVCGSDYRFGREAKGTAADLEKFCKSRGIAFSCPDLVETDGRKISSTELRGLIRTGNFETLNDLLGATFFRTGTVVEGFGKGREIGIRTANVQFGEGLCEIADGVYQTTAQSGGASRKSVTFVGTSETFGRTQKTVECHIPGFEGDLYGKPMRIFFRKKLRDNRKFENFEALVEQIRRDIAESLE